MLRRRRDAASWAALGVRPPRLGAADLAREAVMSVSRHPVRSLVTVIGTILGAGAFVSILGLSSTLGEQVSSSFDVRRATEVIVRAEGPELDHGWLGGAALARVEGLNGVVHAGRRVALKERQLRRTKHGWEEPTGAQIIGADPGALRVMAPTLTVGRLYDDFHEDNGTPVVLLSASVARQVGVDRVGVAVFLDGRALTVIGIYRDVARRTEALTAALVPFSVATRLAGPPAGAADLQRDVVISTAPGAARVIGDQAPLALRPEGPAELRALAPPDPRTLRREVEGSVRRSTVLVSVVALLIGTISVGNSTTAGIAARIGEIGLRRATGARARHIFFQLIAETSLLGGLGGAVGALLGILVTAVVSLVNGWTPVIAYGSVAVACAASTAAGLLAGFLPAVRATRIAPIRALQR
ncbi:MAG TPA: ABC transporter permease [Pilimelia sp.]|nr:ABC transporter permease [Pilimelia sp.]